MFFFFCNSFLASFRRFFFFFDDEENMQYATRHLNDKSIDTTIRRTWMNENDGLTGLLNTQNAYRSQNRRQNFSSLFEFGCKRSVYNSFLFSLPKYICLYGICFRFFSLVITQLMMMILNEKMQQYTRWQYSYIHSQYAYSQFLFFFLSFKYYISVITSILITS